MSRQWETWMTRGDEQDPHGHPLIVFSNDEACADSNRASLNVLFGSTKRPARGTRERARGLIVIGTSHIGEAPGLLLLNRQPELKIGFLCPERNRLGLQPAQSLEVEYQKDR